MKDETSPPHPEGALRTPPKVFVVTPSYNQGAFLRATIDSVLGQEYDNLDYFVADGGSTDESVEILRSYGDRLRWVSAPDGGQSAAVADAWRRSDADILGWLNSDDTYEPGAILRAVAYLARHPELALVYGKAWYIDRDGRKTGSYPTRPFDPDELFHTCYLCQPATFVRREVFEVEEPPDPALRYCMDYDLWIRLARHFRFGYLEEYLASARMYRENKTLGQRTDLLREVLEVTSRHFGVTSRNWTVAYVLHRSRKAAERFRGLLPRPLRRRVEAELVRRGEARLVGPLYADQWAGTRNRLDVEPGPEGRLRLRCQAPFWPYRKPLEISVEMNGHVLGRTRVEREHFSIDVELREPHNGRATLFLVASRTFIPRDCNFADDPRPLSFLVRSIESGGGLSSAGETRAGETRTGETRTGKTRDRG